MSINELTNQLERKIKNLLPKYNGMPIALSGGIDSSLLAALTKPKFVITVEMPDDERFNEIEYAKKVAEYLKIKHIVVKLDTSSFDKDMKVAVKAIGRPIPHFNILPLYQMYKKLHEMGEKEIVLGDGPDETMCGYARDLIVTYLYRIYEYEAFKNYRPLINKILPGLINILAQITEPHKFASIYHKLPKEINEINACEAISSVDVHLMRPDMDDMSNGIARHFGIKNHRPYQDNKELDDFMFNLPRDAKIYNVEYGKYILRKIAEKYLPYDIAWRKQKVGGPLYPANIIKGWLDKGEFDKEAYLKYQQEILDNA